MEKNTKEIKECQAETASAIGSVRLEGLEPSKECLADLALIDQGRMTIEEAIQKAKTRKP